MSKKQLTLLNFMHKPPKAADLSTSDLIAESSGSILRDSKSTTAGVSESTIQNERDPCYGPKCANITLGPYQPHVEFKQSKFGKEEKLRSFQKSWYDQRPWLEYSITLDAAFCFPCRLFSSQSGHADDAFVKKGVSNWKKSMSKFKKHETSLTHKTANQFFLENRLTGKECVATQISSFHQETIKLNREYCKFIFENIV